MKALVLALLFLPCVALAQATQQPTRTVDGLKFSIEKITNKDQRPVVALVVENTGLPVKLIYQYDTVLYDGVQTGANPAGLPDCPSFEGCEQRVPLNSWLSLGKGEDATISFAFHTIPYKKGGTFSLAFKLIKSDGGELRVVNVSLRGVTLP